jgi:hypothetical protein
MVARILVSCLVADNPNLMKSATSCDMTRSTFNRRNRSTWASSVETNCPVLAAVNWASTSANCRNLIKQDSGHLGNNARPKPLDEQAGHHENVKN